MGGSSSHRRQNTRRHLHRPPHSNAHSSPIPIPNRRAETTTETEMATAAGPGTAPRTLNFDNLAITSGLGFNLLCKAGWIPGQPLGLANLSSSAEASPTTSDSNTSDTDPVPSTSPRSSLSAPLPIVVRAHRAGVGAALTPTTTPASQPSPPTHAQASPRRSGRNQRRNQGRGQMQRPSQNNERRRPHPRSNKRHARPQRPSRNRQRHHMQGNNASKFEEEALLSPGHAESPPVVQHMASLDVFDPLRPRCQYDSSHIVRDLKALHKHEQTCCANPARRARRANPTPDMADADVMAMQMHNLQIDEDTLSYSSLGSSDTPMSDMSSLETDEAEDTPGRNAVVAVDAAVSMDCQL